MEKSAAAAAAPAREVAIALEGVSRLLRRLVPVAGLSLTALATLATLERSGPCRLTELAIGEGVTQPAMTQLVSRLQAGGLARRTADTDDRRVVQVELTDAGRDELARRREIRTERLAELLTGLDAEQQAALAAAVPAFDALTRSDARR